MNNALLAGISGLQAHQTMLDVTGSNLANINTYAYKSGRVHFSELLNRTMKAATAPTASVGGTNPLQMNTGVTIDRIDRNMEQGSIVNTSQPLDMAIEGQGFFTLSDGGRNVYTRVGAFAVDSEYYLVDPATGYRVQRLGSIGVADGFQDPYSDTIRVPYDVALPAKTTEVVSYTGNLSADEVEPTTNTLTSAVAYTIGGTVASETNLLANLDQAIGLATGDQFIITGTDRLGNVVNTTWAVPDAATATVADLMAQINAAYSSADAENGASAQLVNGELRLKDNAAGYSLTDINLAYVPAGAGSFEVPAYFKYLEAGGAAAKTTNVEVFDSQGISHTMSASFVKHSDTPNTWDLVLTGVTGAVDRLDDRRIHGITFMPDGSFAGLDSSYGDTDQFQLVFSNDPTNSRVLEMDFGSVGEFNGISQFGGASTVASSYQDGYGPGWLSSLSVTREGVVTGIFTNGIRRDIAELRLTTFQNPAGLTNVGHNYWIESSNSGVAIATKALSGGAGSVRGGALEKSNVDVATEFVNLIEAQNGYQASARTIKVSNEMLQELSNLIR